jgi:hypothetical protein
MELHDLKSGWQNAGKNVKTANEILSMTKISNHPSLKKLRRKLIIEIILLTMFLIIYYDWFDGDQKPIYANALLVVGLLLYILNNVIGYISLTNPAKESNLKLSLMTYLAGIKKRSLYSMLCSFMYSISLILFFVSVIQFNREKWFILLGLVIIFIQVMFWSHRVWMKRINRLETQVDELNIVEEV